MYFDRETTVVVTKLNHLSEIAINNYCQKFGTVIRCLIKTSSHSRNKDPYALVKFAEPASVNTLLTNPNHNIEGVHVLMRPFHHETKTAAPSASNNASTSNSSTNQPRPSHFDQIMQENLALKYEIATLQKSLTEAQNYSKTAYETFQALREKYEAEQILTNQLKSDHAAMIESYENRLKQLPTQTTTTTTTNANEKDKVKDEPMDSDTQQTNHQLEMQIIKDRLEQAQIDLGKCQTENAILQAKLASREQQFEARFKELSCQHARLKKQYEHVTSCIKEFHTKLYPRKRLKLEKRENQQNENSHDGSDDVVEIVMQVDSAPSQN